MHHMWNAEKLHVPLNSSHVKFLKTTCASKCITWKIWKSYSLKCFTFLHTGRVCVCETCLSHVVFFLISGCCDHKFSQFFWFCPIAATLALISPTLCTIPERLKHIAHQNCWWTLTNTTWCCFLRVEPVHKVKW